MSRARLPRRIRPGTAPLDTPGAHLRCLVLAATADEWVGVDLASGAFVRIPGPIEGLAGDASRALVVVDTEIAAAPELPDPARPELLYASSTPTVIGTPRRRAIRHLLRRLATPERQGSTILNTRGPSIPYVDLDGSSPSLSLLAVASKRLELGSSPGGSPLIAIGWGGTTQRVRIADRDVARAAMASAPRSLSGAQLAAALGYRPGFALVGLGRVTEGHAPKILLALL